MLEKNVFIIFSQGDVLPAKIKKICEALGATIYTCPEAEGERSELLQEVNSRLGDLVQVTVGKEGVEEGRR
jgi:vacuolar-type H+-ATPase subunit I/STV1